MSFNMMFKKAAVCFFFVCILSVSRPAEAKEEKLPGGEILIVYQDGADAEEMDEVYTLVKTFTCQELSIVFAPVKGCKGQLKAYQSILFYNLRDADALSLSEEIFDIEKQTRTGEEAGKVRLLFAGNEFLKGYLDRTGRFSYYDAIQSGAGRMEYPFADTDVEEGLVRSDGFLFLRKTDNTVGTVETEQKEGGYFFAQKGIFSHICTAELSNPVVRAAFTRESVKWASNVLQENETYPQYLVFHRIFPFEDPGRLLKMVKLAVERDEPFAISVMPLYDNLDYPAMQSFCEVLRYAQANKGAVVLHSPIQKMKVFDVDLINEQIKAAIGAYIRQGVYPVGIEAPAGWLFHDDTAEVLNRFHTVFISEEEADNIRPDKSVNSNGICRDQHQFIDAAVSLDDGKSSYLTVLPSAVYIDGSLKLDEMEKIIDNCRSSFVPLGDLWDLEHTLRTTVDTVEYQNRILTVNGQREKLTYTLEKQEEYAYRRNMRTRYSKDLTEENRRLLLAVAGVSLLFILFIVLARRNNRERFFFEDENTEEEKKNQM